MKLMKSKPGLKKHYESMPESVKSWYRHLPSLIDNYELSIVLSYAFFRLEEAETRAIRYGLTRKLKVSTVLADTAVDTWHYTREGFRWKFKEIYGEDLRKQPDLKAAEEVRDRLMHGKQVQDRSIRNALGAVLTFSGALGEKVMDLAGFTPFGDLTGNKGRTSARPDHESRLLLKGLEFKIG